MAKEQFESIIEVQNNFRQSNILCDVTLLSDDGVIFPAHKVILSSCSTFFLSMFDADFKEKNEQTVKIKEIDSYILEIIIKYIYTLKLDMTEDNIVDILKAVYFFQLDIVKEQCCDFIENNINLTNCIGIMQFAKIVSNDRLYNFSFAYVLENLFQLEDSILYNLSYEEIMTLISNNYLATESEDQVYMFVLNWVKFDEKIRKIFLPELMKNIRWSLISKTILSNPLFEPLLKDYTIMENIIKCLSDTECKYGVDGLNDKNRKRIPKNIINKSDIIIAIDNVDHNISNKVYYSDLSNNLLQWTPGPTFFLPPNKNSIIVGFENLFLFSIGGRTNHGIVTNEVYILDLSTISRNWIQVASMISARDYHSVCIHNKYIFSVGGVDTDGHILNTIEVFNITTNKWSIYCSMMNSRKKCSTVYHNNFLYIIGGINENAQYLSVIECYDDLSRTWENYIDPLPKQLCQACVTIFKNELYIFGGCSMINNQCLSLNTAFKFTLIKGSEWCSLPSLLTARHLASVVVIKEKLYIFGGLNNNINNYSLSTNNYSLSIEVLDPQTNKLIGHHNLLFEFKSQNLIMFNKHYITSLGVNL